MNIIEFAKEEFRHANWTDENGKFYDEIQKMMCDGILKLLEVFAEEHHTGFTASYALNIFEKLARWEPISQITGEDSEWVEVSENLWQNKRCSRVFKDENGAYDIDGIVWYRVEKDENGEEYKDYFTNRKSRVDITFPYSPTTVYKQEID